MRKTVFLLLALFFVSCAPLLKKETCELRFQTIKELSRDTADYKIRGNIFLHGIYLVFHGKLGKTSNLTVRTPFGNRLFTVEYSKQQVCVETKSSSKICGKELDIYWDYLNINAPFDLKELLTGRFPVSEKAQYRCEGRKLIITQDGAEFIYDNNRIKEVHFKGFSAIYNYDEDRLKKIVVKDGDTEVFRIYIRQLERI